MKYWNRFVLLVLLLVCWQGTKAENNVKIVGGNGAPGSIIDISIQMDNSDAVSALQLSIPMNDNIKVVEGSAVVGDRAVNHSATVGVKDGYINLVVYSASMSAIAGNSGEVARFQLQLGKEPTNVVLSSSKLTLTDCAGKPLSSNVENGTVVVLTPKAEYNTREIDFGRITIRGKYSQKITIENVGNESLTISDLLFSSSEFSCSEGLPFSVAAGRSKVITINYAPLKRGNISEELKVVCNSSSKLNTIALKSTPYAVNELHVGSASGTAGEEVEIKLRVKNMDAITGFQFEFNLPKELIYVDGSFTLTSRKVDHQLMATLNGSTLKVICYSLSDKPFTGTDGDIATFKVRLDGQYNTILSTDKAQLTATIDGKNQDVLSDMYYGNIQISSPSITGNKELNLGNEPITAIPTCIYHINNYGSAPLTVNKVVFTTDDFIITDEFPITIKSGDGYDLHVTYKNKSAGRHSAQMNIYNNDPNNKMYSVDVVGTLYSPNFITLNCDGANTLSQANIGLTLSNHQKISGIQFDFTYPSDVYSFNVENIELGTNLTGFSKNVKQISKDVSRVFIYSMSGNVVEVDTAKIMTLHLQPRHESIDAGNYVATISKLILGNENLENVKSEESASVSFNVSVPRFKLTYKVDGKIYQQHEVEYNAAITPEAVPNKEGYTFSGWSEILETMPSHDVEVTGSFIVNKYKVTFISDGITSKEEILDFGTVITAPENPTKVGNTFKGWNPAVDATVPAHDVTYVAQFSVNKYTITFDTDGGSGITPVTQDFNTTITAPVNPTKTGYTFAGWDKEIPETMPAENIAVKALWTINKYKLTYKVGSELYKQYEVEYNAAITPETAPEKEGYTFSGWSEIPATMPANDLEVNGLFTINQYKVTFVVDGVAIKEETLDFGSAITAPENPSKAGYTFSTWNPIVDPTVPSHDLTYVAQFSINQYTMTFDTDGGSEIASITQDYNTEITVPANPSKAGYTFAGWNKEIPITMPAENITIKALWTINKYMLTYKVDGEVYKQYEVEYNATITPEAAPTKEGHTFSGWSEIPATMPANDVEVNGTFSINKYMLTYQVDGEIYQQDSVTFGSTIVLIDEPVLEGKTFSGWKGTPETMPAHDVTIVGSFKDNVYTVTYKVGGEVYKSILYEYGENITPEAAPNKEGYTFSGWSEIPATMPSHDVEVTGTFSINQYKVTFISEGVIISEETLDFGSPITVPEEPTKIGHAFAGWTPAVDSTVPAHDVTYTAQFSVNKYKLIYMIDGEKYKEYEVEYSETIVPETTPEKEGYTFSGWSETPTIMPANDVEVNGKFTINQYKVTFVVDGEIIKQETLDFASPITAPENPTKIGYTFTGWNSIVDATVPAHDVTYEAMFEINTYKLTYYVDGEVYKELEVEYDSEIIPEDNPIKEGCNFSGWSEIPQFMPDHNVEIHGTFNISTGINSDKSESNNKKVYDMSGNRMTRTKKGINIINGKKILIK